ncbi:glycosyltransferase [Tropicibacter oceani]|uniref:Glycosyltransferase n=1 Tax=Tropicibacter oceani TaxID=3058420 RepID=A0ABY8QEN9_9RHOB|nr:glycosyltransferase [Tropicibacter oceani]WGW02980.1 glycosyltransferase [Tropicibacter oceani]
MTDTPAPPAWMAHAAACDDALEADDLPAAEAYLQSALAVAETVPAKLWLLQAEVLTRRGAVREAEEVLDVACISFPANFWPPYRLAQLLHARGDSAQAAQYFDLCHAAGPRADLLPLHALDLEVSLAAQSPAGVVRAYRALMALAPQTIDNAQVLAQLAAMPGGAVQAVPLYQEALQATPDDRPLLEAFITFLTTTCPPEAAVPGLEFVQQSQGGDLGLLLRLARIYRQLGVADKQEAVLQQAVRDHPTAPDLLRYLFDTQLATTDSETLTTVVGALRSRIPDRLHTELASQLALTLMDFDTASTLLRAHSAQGKAPHEAQMLATALIGQGRHALALRYLSRCTRHWPQAPGLVSFHIIWALKLGRIEDARRTIEACDGKLPEAVLTAHRFLLAGMQNDLDGAIASYARLRANKDLTEEQRRHMAKLIFSLADITRLEAIKTRIGDPLGEKGGLLHRAGLPGAMALELQLESRDYAARGGYACLADWRHTRPHSVVAAIRLIDDWRANAPDWPHQPAIPRRIFQYWDKSPPPQIVSRMCQSWAEAPGFEHDLYDRPRAQRFLRETFGPVWLRAFDMARNPAEEADLLRLCLLVKFGGVWADADDWLYGDLGALLDGAHGLTLYREPLGGTLGNNFIAAPPGHPALIFAAKLVRAALLERSADIAWSKTGPGVLTRALAHFLVQVAIPLTDHPVTIVDAARIGRVVAMHNPVRYKTLPSHWAADGKRKGENRVWPDLLDALQSADPA